MSIRDWSSDVCASQLINFQKLNTYNASLNLEYDFGPVTDYSITSYWNGNFRSRGDIDGGFGAVFLPESGPGLIPFQAQSQDNVPSLDQFTQEIRIALNNSGGLGYQFGRSEEHTSELQSLMRRSYAVFFLKKKKNINMILQH